ncbi:leucine-rich repeat serine/threonine-protein kinase 1-like [Carassius gibelio]|uniref:leucine-rich repeat serine/threonine-protein kinase 1-like n=1 Tax=Carassius gibelio TaxID=101364 RepID=UPI002278F3AF|nr:leucine-rich repeat serine/threonine-protein kinase 1-like [Carassius gibelio]
METGSSHGLCKLYFLDAVWLSEFICCRTFAPKPALDIGFRQQSNNSIQLHFKMSFVPAGFWERFIARMLISLKQMDVQALETKRVTKSPRNHSTVISQTIYWREGLLVTFDGGYLRLARVCFWLSD